MGVADMIGPKPARNLPETCPKPAYVPITYAPETVAETTETSPYRGGSMFRFRRDGRWSMTRPALIPPGSWPRRMGAELAAGYCGEPSVEAFMSRVGKEYPRPRVCDGRRRLWLKDDLDEAILPPELAGPRDVAGDL